MISFPQNDSRHIQRAHCSPSLSIVKQPEGVVWYNPFVCHEITIKITLKSSCPFVNSSKWWFFREEPHYISLIYINLYYISMIIIYTYIYYIYMNPWGASHHRASISIMEPLRYEPPARNGFGMSLLAPTCPGGSCQWYNQGVNRKKKHVVLPRVNNISAIKSNLENFGSETPNLENNGDVQLKTWFSSLVFITFQHSTVFKLYTLHVHRRRLWNRLCRDHRNPVRLWEARGTNPFVGSGWSLAAVQRGEITGIADILRPRKLWMLWMLWLLIELRGCWFLERFDSFRMLHVHLCNLIGKPEKVDGAKHDPIRSLVLPPWNGRTAMEGTPSTTPGVIRAMHPWKTLAEWWQAEGNPWASWIRHPGSARDMKGRSFPSCWRKLSGWLVQLWKPLGSIRILHTDPAYGSWRRWLWRYWISRYRLDSWAWVFENRAWRAWWLDGLMFPVTSTLWWIVAKVAWGIAANHGGGYQYRLCPASEDPTEECFQKTPLEFVGEVSWMSAWYNCNIL